MSPTLIDLKVPLFQQLPPSPRFAEAPGIRASGGNFPGMAQRSLDRFLEFYSAHLGRALTAEEVNRVRFVFQMMRGTFNNAILNWPGPFKLDDPEFLRQMERAFILVAALRVEGESKA